MTCSYDYLTMDANHVSFIVFTWIYNFAIPMLANIYLYSSIVKAVVSHERALRAQAKKMNVDSLRSNEVRKSALKISMKYVRINKFVQYECLYKAFVSFET